ncbi:MAG: rRNA maturation RNase YbeY [bacterium]
MKLRLIDRRSNRSWSLPDQLQQELERLCARTGRPDWLVDLVLVDDDRMTTLNQHYRNQPTVTDVLSFSYLESAGAGPPRLSGGDAFAATDLWWNPVTEESSAVVGEIALATTFVRERCRTSGWDDETEIAMLTIHGILHILGWEHDDPETTDAMRTAESELLAHVGRTHPLTEGE